MVKAQPTGSCWCGCGAETARGSFFVPGHDRVAETAVVQTRYGSVPDFLLHHGFGPGKLNPKDELAAHRLSARSVARPPSRRVESATDWREEAARLWPVLVDLARRKRSATYKDVGAIVEVFHRNLRLPLELIQQHCAVHRLPRLTVLVVNGDTQLPGAGFAGSLEELDQLRSAVFAFDWSAVTNPFEEPT